MREILFRGKRTDNGEWVEGDLLGKEVIVPKGQDFYVEGHYLDSGLELYAIDPETVGQYTGLKDKNGKRIFKGDIVKQTVTFFDEVAERVGKVVEDEVNPCFVLENIKNPLDIEYDFIKCFLSKLEVIGNIYDNPELLEEVQL